jgi:hypothetical protein
MKNWKYKVQSSPQEVIDKLQSAFASASGFIFNVDKDAASFMIRKPVIYPDQILHRNRVIANGKISHTNPSTEHGADIDISFVQDFYMKMTVFSIIVSAAILLALISRLSSGVIIILLGAMILAVGIILWLALERKLQKDTQKYKTLITEVLEST